MFETTIRYEEKCNCRHRYSIAKMNRKLYMKGEMDGAKEKDDRMASGIHGFTSD
mgnify:CR=1 FL=1